MTRRSLRMLLVALVVSALLLPTCGRRRAMARRAGDNAPAMSRQRSAPPAAPGEQHSIRVGGETRSYVLHVPRSVKNAPKSASPPLMIVLHGGMGNDGAIRGTTGMDEIAEKGAFVVVYPNGTSSTRKKDRRTWNAGTCCGRASRQGVDDVGFIDQMIRDIEGKIPIDTTRIYATGFSNGGMMTYRLACQLPSRIAGAVVVAGALLVDDCQAGRNVPIYHIHGDSDGNVRYEGGRGKFVRTIFPSVAKTIAAVARPRDCAPPQVSVIGGDRVASYECSRGAPIKLRTINSGQHRWPDGSASYRGFSASQAAWEFAREFRKDAS